MMWREMAIKFEHDGVPYTVDTPKEAAELRALFKIQDTEATRNRGWHRLNAKYGTHALKMMDAIEQELETPWTHEVFLTFIARLGKPQKSALALLVTHKRLTDVELRESLNATNNQALAGVLSGISKQAAALNIDARDIFTFENLRNGGKRRSTYAISDKFSEIASRMNWPGPEVPAEH
jgi:hypothetical protein